MKISMIRKKIGELILDIFYRIYIGSCKKGDNILITATDGIGDVIIRKNLIDGLLKKYENKKIYVLSMDKSVDLLRLFGFENIIIYERHHRKTILGQFKMIRKLSNLGLSKILTMEFGSDNTFLRYFNDLPVIGFKGANIDKYYSYKIDRQEGHIIHSVKEYYSKVLEEDIPFQDLVPSLEGLIKWNPSTHDTITLGIGANARLKLTSPSTWRRCLDYILETTNYNFILLGYGKREEELGDTILSFYKGGPYEKRFTNFISKKTLLESMSVIASSDIYIGNDSGLYNIASTLNMEVIGFFSDNNMPYDHKILRRVSTLNGVDDRDSKDLIIDPAYGTSALNNISLNRFKDVFDEALKRLK